MADENKDFLDEWFDGDEEAAKEAAKKTEDADEDDDKEPDKQADTEDQSDDDADDDEDDEGERDEEPSDEPGEDDPGDKKRPDPEQFKGYIDERVKRQAERDKREAAEAKLEAANARIAQLEQQETDSSGEAETPDPITDAEGFAKYQQEQLAQVEHRANMRAQEYTARHKFGDEKIDAAVSAMETEMKSNPGVYRSVMSSPFPYEALMNWHGEKEFLSEVAEAGGKDAWLKLQAEKDAEDGDGAGDDDGEETPKRRGGKPPPSLSGKGKRGKKGGSKVQTEDEVFDEVFGPRY